MGTVPTPHIMLLLVTMLLSFALHGQLPTSIYVVTEEALPLQDSIGTTDGSTSFSIAWGLHQVIVSRP